MIRSRVPALLLAPLLAAAGPARGDGPIGFAPASRAAQAKAEARALAVPTPDQARGWLRTLTKEPHVAGTEADRRTALFVRDRLRSWGWQADLAEFQALLNYPVDGSVTLELLRPAPKKLRVTEEPLVADKDSDHPDAFPAFHGYGVSGDVKGQVVYANYGQPEDYDALEKLGIDVKGKIVLVRYGALFRGLKLRHATARGAKGMLVYSDPAEDGYAQGDVYPNGPFRPGSAIQRGSVQSLALRPGDPSTPGGASIKGAKRLPIDERHGFPLGPGVAAWEESTGLKREDVFATIPSLPIGYDAARPILEALGGPNVPEGWQGALPLPYHTGPGPAEVHFSVQMDYKVRPIWNVIATLRGGAAADQWVLVGNHRDAWAYGAVDPGSGTACTLEMCRALGAAVKAGWTPRRTIVYGSWDAEEYDLVGSTEWAEEHAAELASKAVMMLNVDAAVSGATLDIGGVASLRDLVVDAAGGVTDVRTGKPLSEVWIARRRGQWAQDHPVDLDETPWGGAAGPDKGGKPRRIFSPQMNPLGSGSDYTAFLDHLGIPALDISFSGRYGVYHSTYDNAFWMEKFGDPEFLTHATAAKLYTLIAMRAAGADVLPLRFAPLGEALRDHVDDLRRRLDRKARAADPDAERPPPFPGLAGLIAAVKRFRDRASALDRATEALAARDDVPPARLARVNDALRRVEPSFLIPDGLPGRPWFRHALYAPSLATGYGCWPLPALRRAVAEDDDPALAAAVSALIGRLDAAVAVMGEAIEACEKD